MSPTATTTYTLTATNAAGSTTSTLTVTVTAASKADDQLLHGEPHEHHFGFQQHAELGDDRGDEHCHHAGDIHVHIRERFDEREPDGDDHLHADGDQCRGLDHGHGNSHGNSVRRPVGDHDHFVPRRNTRRGVCRLHNRRQRRHSALHLFRDREFQLPPLPEGMSLNATTGAISSSLIGGQGTYTPEFVVTDSTSAQATRTSASHQRQQRLPRKHLSVNFDFSPSRGRGHDQLARRYFPRRADVQRLSVRDGEAILREQFGCSLSEWNTGHRGSLQPGGRRGYDHAYINPILPRVRFPRMRRWKAPATRREIGTFWSIWRQAAETIPPFTRCGRESTKAARGPIPRTRFGPT